MRTADEINAQIEDVLIKRRDYQAPDYDEGYLHLEGLETGLKRGLIMTSRGQTTADIRQYADAISSEYQSVGDDLQDAWQMGYIAALLWCGEVFDWDEQGGAVFRVTSAQEA